MRQVRNPQLTLGEVCVEDIPLDLKSRDDIPDLMLGLQYLYSDETFRPRLFALLDEDFLPGIDKSVGRPGMEMWRIIARSTAPSAPGRAQCAARGVSGTARRRTSS